MSELMVNQTTIHDLFSHRETSFLIPDYQRPYSWGEEQCQKLWDDFYAFSFQDSNGPSGFNENDKYFIGSIITHKNENGQSEVIDGQQRIITLLLLLRAFYTKFDDIQRSDLRYDGSEKIKYKGVKDKIKRCIWREDEYGAIDKSLSALKIDSEVATDEDKKDVLHLLRYGEARAEDESRYIRNYRFFQKNIDDFLQDHPSLFASMPARILGCCTLLPIEAASQDTALRIFSTLNDRGLPLSDTDIFKAQFYKYYSSIDKKDYFIERWRNIEGIVGASKSTNVNPMDELFTRYMYFLRAKEGVRSATIEGLRKFYEHDKYRYFKDETTMTNVEALAGFWKDIMTQNKKRFSEGVLKRIFVLNYAPNTIWQHITSVYFLSKKDTNHHLQDSSFCGFLNRITAYIIANTIVHNAVGALRAPIYDEMANIIEKGEVSFARHRFDEERIRSAFEASEFTNRRPITRSILAWYAFTFPQQRLLPLDKKFQIEHIYAKKQYEKHKDLNDVRIIELLGNKVLLEQTINIQASYNRFADKKKIYLGQQRSGKRNSSSKIYEVAEIAKHPFFSEKEINNRNKAILDKFLDFLHQENLLVKKH